MIKTEYDSEKVKKIFADCRGALSYRAFDPENSRGRRDGDDDRDGPLLGLLDPYKVDTWKLKNSKARRRQQYKTQVYTENTNAHVRTRLSHTDETEEYAKILSSILGLNTNLVESICVGHDLGHTPFGHIGEVALSNIGGKTLRHHRHGVFVSQYIERKGKGLNLTYETLLGMALHSKGKHAIDFKPELLEELLIERVENELYMKDFPKTEQTRLPVDEMMITMISDTLYLCSDYNDVKRHGSLPKDFRLDCMERLGNNQTERVNMIFGAVVEESARKGRVSFSEGTVFELFKNTRDFMYDNMYNKIDWENHEDRLKKTCSLMVDLFADSHYFDPVVLVSLMTDKDVNAIIDKSNHLRRIDMEMLNKTSVGEMVPYLMNREFRYWEYSLDWARR